MNGGSVPHILRCEGTKIWMGEILIQSFRNIDAETGTNPLKTDFLLNNIQKFSWYLTGNTLRLRYKGQRVNAVRETIAVYCENHTEHKDTLCGQNAKF
jgi:hypothetical protein